MQPSKPSSRVDGPWPFLAFGGEMGGRIRAFDWGKTALGPIESWPGTLTAAVNVVLPSRYPMFVWWGSELINIYNDAYSPFLGQRHPVALGRPAAETWADIWPTLHPQISAVLEGRGATWDEDLLLVMERNAFVEETYFTFSYSPVLDEAGVVRGLFCACNETTERVVGERRIDALRQLAAATTAARTTQEVCDAAVTTFQGAGRDISFALIYRVGPNGRDLHLLAATGIVPGDVAAPVQTTIGTAVWPFGEATGDGLHVLPPPSGVRLPGGQWPEPAQTVVLAPLKGGDGQLIAFLVAGASPRLAFNERYQTFFELIAGTLSRSISASSSLEEERKREARFRAFVTASSDVVYRMNADWTELSHLDGRDFIRDTSDPDRTWLQTYIHAEDQERVMSVVREAIRLKVPYELEHRIFRVDGTLGWVFSRAIPIFDSEGRIVEWFGAASDITERKHAEAALRESEERYRELATRLELTVSERTAALREKVTDLEAFSYSISHDMRSPLRSMRGFAEALLEDYADRIDETGREYLSRIVRGSQRLDLLIRDVLAYSKVAKGEFALHAVDLEALIRDILHAFEIPASTVEIVPPIPRVAGHIALLTQIFSNLLANARKFARPDVPLAIRIWSEQVVGGRVRVLLRDNGIGIEPQHFTRIFEIFGRVHADKAYEGTGIGLAIVKKAAERLGGSAGVASTQGQGSTFWIELAEA